MANKFRFQRFLQKGLNVVRDDPIFSTDRLQFLRSIRSFQLIALHAYRNLDLYYSQSGQDVFVSQFLFPGLKEGFFVDCGARCGTVNSNSRMLEEHLGWKGILIEPNRSNFAQAIENRLAECLHTAVSRQQGSMKLLDVEKEPGHSRLLEDAEEAEYAGRDGFQIYDVPVMRLADILYSRDIDHVHYLDIDVEGQELNVIEGIDFEAVSFDVISAESPPVRYEAIRESLERFGFYPYCRLGVDTFFLPQSRFDEVDRLLGLQQLRVS